MNLMVPKKWAIQVTTTQDLDVDTPYVLHPERILPPPAKDVRLIVTFDDLPVFEMRGYEATIYHANGKMKDLVDLANAAIEAGIQPEVS